MMVTRNNRLVLDVGCGANPRGNVNVDVSVHDEEGHRGGSPLARVSKQKTPNFVLADGCYLPFKSETFDEVITIQTIEHIPKPQLFFSELVRVSKGGKITIETAHRWGEILTLSLSGRRWHRKHHVSKMNFSYLRTLARLYGLLETKHYVGSWIHFPHEYLPWVSAPSEFGVEFFKEDKQVKPSFA